MKKTIAILSILLVAVIFVSGCVNQTANNNTTANQTEVTSSQVSGEINQNLLPENQTTVEIGDMV